MVKPVMNTERDVIGHRIIAVILDAIIMGAISGIVVYPFYAAWKLGVLTLGAMAVGGMAVLLLWALYGVIMEGFYSQTIGKMVMGIMVVKPGGKRINIMDAFVRNIFRIIDGLPGIYLVGFVIMALNKHRQRLGDIMANTYVVRAKI